MPIGYKDSLKGLHPSLPEKATVEAKVHYLVYPQVIRGENVIVTQPLVRFRVPVNRCTR